MTHHATPDVAAEVQIQSGGIVSKVIHRDDILNITAFAFDTGQELTEHRTARTALVQVITGRLLLKADGEELDAGPGFWLHMAPDTPHSLIASEPTIMLLTLLRS
jgi:quercetin dioxygenase-like cupin family protein